MSLILIGLPGAGKGTQAEKITDTYGIPHISTRDMLRAAIQSETAFGLEAGSYMDKGALVPDEVTNGVVKERLVEPDTGKGFLLDSFPRTLDQAKALDTMLKDLNKRIDAAIDIHVSEEILVGRLIGRFICSNCGATYHKTFSPTKVEGTRDRYGRYGPYQRGDDKPEAVENRLVISIKDSEPILAYYREQGLLNTIDGARKIDIVFVDAQETAEK